MAKTETKNKTKTNEPLFDVKRDTVKLLEAIRILDVINAYRYDCDDLLEPGERIDIFHRIDSATWRDVQLFECAICILGKRITALDDEFFTGCLGTNDDEYFEDLYSMIEDMES